MSFTEKIGQLMHRPNDDLVSKDDVSPWLKYTGRVFGVFAGSVAIFFGFMECFWSILSLDGLMAGFWQILAAFTVLIIEAPLCCMFVDHVQDASNWVDKRPYWHRAAYYMIVAIPPVYLDFGFSTFTGCGLIFATGILYGMMAIGKKGTRADMAAAATSPGGTIPQSEHHTTLMEDPDVWRPAASREEMSTNASTIFGNNMQSYPPAHTSSAISGRPNPNPFDSGV